jgi:hypothetical protein
MQTHDDNNHGLRQRFLDELRSRADRSEKAGAAVITAGAPDEKPLAQWKASNGMHVRHLPDDEQGILRISAGGGEHLPVTLNYLVVRGPVGQCIELLEKALVALRESPE